MSKKNGLADPIHLKPFDSDDKQLLRVVIETPKGSRNKFAFDPDERVFELKKVLPAGMTFPYDFGFVPSTEADDGDPVDGSSRWTSLHLQDASYRAVLWRDRGRAGSSNNKERNDEIIAVEKDAHSWADIKTISDLGKEFCRELEEFFVNYHKLSGEQIPRARTEGTGSSSKTREIGHAMRISVMTQRFVRFLVGGAVVSLFAIIGDLLKLKGFAGLFGRPPSAALATLGLTVATEGASNAATEARSMMAGAIAFTA